MEQETSTPGRSFEESAAWFQVKLAELGISQSALAQRMAAAGDDRQFKTILRSLSRMATGETKVSGEMRTLLGVLGEAAMYERMYREWAPSKPDPPDIKSRTDISVRKQWSVKTLIRALQTLKRNSETSNPFAHAVATQCLLRLTSELPHP